MSGLSRALAALAVAGFVLGLAALAIVTTSERTESTSWIVLALTMGWAFIGAGLYAWWRRPENRVGPLMTMVGFFWFLGALQSADTAWAYTLGLALGMLWLGALVQMLVAFPAGRVQPGFERAVVALGWIAALVISPLAPLVIENRGGCDECPENVLHVWGSETASDIAEGLGVVVTIALLIAVGVVLVRRWRSYGPVQRRALAPVAWIAAALAAVAALAVPLIALG